MKEIEVVLIKAFTVDGHGGNAAGVVLHADNLLDEEKLAIARAVGYSETAFVCHDSQVDFALSFFTTTNEVDFCGHATLASFSTLYHKGLIKAGRYVQRTKAGLLAVIVELNGHIVMEQKQPEYIGYFEYDDISGLIGIESNILASTQLPIEVVSTGLADIIVPVPFGYLEQIQVDEPRLSEFCKCHNIIGMHAFELCEDNSELTASCRNFAPLFGIPEEPATGSASGALACYLTKHLGSEKANSYIFEQGRAMQAASIITAFVELKKTGSVDIMVGGFANEFGRQIINI